MSHIRLPPPVAAIYEAVAELEKLYPGRKFTPDGHLVGSIGEVIAAKALGLELYPASYAGHDAKDATGRDVQIKLTGGKSVSLYATCDRLVVLRVVSPHLAEIVYDGFGAPAWESAGPLQKNGQRTISLAKLKRIVAAGPSQVDPISEESTPPEEPTVGIKLVRAVRVSALPGHRLNVAFSDLSSGVIDLSDWVLSGGPMVQPLADETFFAKVFLEMGTPTWPNGCDADPTNMRMQLESAGSLKTNAA
ncbi:DUF2442 domain-containing protein [Caulobacter sp. B11]|uniref:DUF6998 domain-containing protein n=1 Tax=Caulobacter sp. B11 TaxID=2048899 RepID=UPI001F39DF0B|nr:DUF2442 domain-containing protein [Caulobacter sp. B11]